MILLKAELVALADTGLEGLRSAMQAAIELEHATLPPYMYALYSIRAGTNVAASRILRSIVMQEMVHLTLCCNILNAIGGVPVLNKPNFIPPYPGPLPGGIDDGLQVPLAPLSLTLVHDAFMVIEEPEDPLEFPVVEAAMLILPAPKTIGQFYARIKEQLQSLAQTQNIFTGDASRQLTSGLPGVKGVNDLASAMAAIDLIVVQGEGTTTTPLDALSEPAHYYRFAEIFHQRKLVAQVGTPPFAYAGDAVSFEPAGVLPVISNPTPALYVGTAAEAMNNAFNHEYTNLLSVLHETFNGDPDQIDAAIDLMDSVKSLAVALMGQPIAAGQNAGPTFTYRPVA